MNVKTALVNTMELVSITKDHTIAHARRGGMGKTAKKVNELRIKRI